MKNRYKVFISGIFFIIIPLYAQHNLTSQIIKVPFDVNKVIEGVAHHPRPHKDIVGLDNSNLREGEFLVDTNVVYGPAVDGQWYSSIAFDGTNYMVVWQDLRGSPWSIYGARVDTSGNVLDPAGIVISTVGGERPSVAFDGTNYLIVWSTNDIYGARVDQTGNVLDPDGIAISTVGGERPSVAFDGTNYLVVWQDNRSGSWDIYGARVDQTGNVLDPYGIAISIAANIQLYPSMTFNGTHYLIVWSDKRSGAFDIYGARVDTSGTVLEPTGIAIATTTDWQMYPSVAFDDTNCLVVWQDERNGVWDIYGTRVDTSGNLLDPVGIAISTATGGQVSPSVAFDNTNYLIVWSDERSGSSDIYGTRVDQTGNVLDTTGIAILTAAGGQVSPSVAFDNTNYLIVWQDFRSGSDSDIYGTRVDQAGNTLDPNGITISTAANFQWHPSIAFDSTNYLIVWQDVRSGWYNADIYGMRVDQAGNVLDPDGITISTATGGQYGPSIAFDNTNYLVVWQDARNSYYYDIYGARVDQAGNILDLDGIAISTAAGGQYEPSAVFDGTNYLIVWSDTRSGNWAIYGARVDRTGNVLDPTGITISTNVDEERHSSIAFDNTNYLVVWQDFRSWWDYDIYGARVDTSGNVLDPAGIAISTAVSDQLCPSVAFDNTNYLVVWEDYRSGDWDIYGARVNPSGTLLDTAGIAISTAAGGQVSPSVAFDNTNYLVVWQDFRSGSDSDIYGAKLNTTGTVIDSFAVSLQIGRQISPALAHGQGNQSLIIYSGWTDSINTHPANTMRIWGKLYPFTGIEEETGFQIPTSGFGLDVYPNPAHKKCHIKYILSQNSNVNISMFDIVGRLVKEIVSENQHGGVYHKAIDITDLSQGIYFIRLVVDYEGEPRSHKETKKVILLK